MTKKTKAEQGVTPNVGGNRHSLASGFLTPGQYFYECSLAFMLAVRERSRAKKVILTLSEGQMLGAIAARDATTGKELSELLHLEKSTISRLLQGLHKRSLIAYQKATDDADARMKSLSLSEKGRTSIALDDSQRSAVTESLLGPLSNPEKEELAAFLGAVADAFSVPKQVGRDTEHFMRPVQRRLSQVLGVMGSDFMRTGLTVVSLHLLRAIGLSVLLESDAQKAPQVRSMEIGILKQMFPFDSITMSRSLAELEGKGWIKSTRKKLDRRRVLLSLTASGVRALRLAEKKAVSYLETPLGSLPKELMEKGLALLGRCVEFRNLFPSRDFIAKTTFSSLCSDKDRAIARAFLVRSLMDEGLELSIPAEMFLDNSLAFSLSERGNMRLACEVLSKESGFELRNICSPPQGVSSQVLTTFLLEVASRLRAENASIRVVAPLSGLPSPFMYRALPQIRAEGRLFL